MVFSTSSTTDVKLPSLQFNSVFVSSFLKIYVICVASQPSGTKPLRRDKLGKDVRSLTLSFYDSLRISGYMFSGPAILFVFKPLIAFRTTSFCNECSELVCGALFVSSLVSESLVVM